MLDNNLQSGVQFGKTAFGVNLQQKKCCTSFLGSIGNVATGWWQKPTNQLQRVCGFFPETNLMKFD